MITLTATINLLSSNGSISSLAIDKSGNNISSDISSVLGSTKNGRNPFILSSSKLGFGACFSSNVDYFISKQLCDTNGNFAQPFVLTIEGTNLTNLTIVFDDVNKRHPYNITIDGVEHTDDDPIFLIPSLSGATHTINISNWNEPNSPLVIQGIYTNLTITLDNRSLIEITRNIRDSADDNLPSYGIISNAGNIKFKDLNREVQDYIRANLLQDKQDVKIYINDTLNDSTVMIANYKTNKWDYDNNNFVVSVSLKDDLEELQNIIIPGIEYDIKNGTPITCETLYNKLLAFTPSKYKFPTFDSLDISTKELLSNITIEYPMLKSCNLWKAWNDFCILAQLHIYKNINGDVVCKYLGGN